jgi:2,3-bisphosphoglycerate-independent phosphoglycerate mutase
MGNSEVGHMTIGGGRIIKQELVLINDAINDGSLSSNPSLATISKAGSCCHVMGLISDGGVHTHIDHLLYITNYLSGKAVQIKLHLFADGRDVPPRSIQKYLTYLEQQLKNPETVSIATLSGRYYAMDRDNRWDRTELAYRAIMNGEGKQFASVHEAVEAHYASYITDEFFPPSVIGSYQGVSNSDTAVMTNFRSDRVRQILSAMLLPDFACFNTGRAKFAQTLTITEYASYLAPYIDPLFPPQHVADSLGEFISKNGLKQFRIAETEKYPHITFFFNGGLEKSFTNETRILIDSPKVKTYDEMPEMSAHSITEKVLEAIYGKEYDFILVNYANADMVGHTGIIGAAIKAVKTIDQCVANLTEAVRNVGGVLLVTADHGNIEQIRDVHSSQPHTYHTLNKVPFVMITDDNVIGKHKLRDSGLCDIAPTVIELLGLKKPPCMTGSSLLG